MKTADEVQRAHDLLWGFVTGEVGKLGHIEPLTESDRQFFHASLDTLCWVLGHGHNPAFAANMAALERRLAEAGYRITKKEETSATHKKRT